jgi:hypothetical protein
MELKLQTGTPMVCAFVGADGEEARRHAIREYPNSKIVVGRIATDEELAALEYRNVWPLNVPFPVKGQST